MKRIILILFLFLILPAALFSEPVEEILTYYDPHVPGHYHVMPRNSGYALYYELQDFDLPAEIRITGVWVYSAMYGMVVISLCEDDTTNSPWEHFPSGDTLTTVTYLDPGGISPDTVSIGGIDIRNDMTLWIVIDHEIDGVPFFVSAQEPPTGRTMIRSKATGAWYSDIDDWSVGLLIEYEAVGSEPDPEPANLPRTISLHQNYPNPCNPQTTITLDTKEGEVVNLSIYNMRGVIVKHLFDGVYLDAGRHSIVWDGTDAGGRSVESGIYFYRLETGDDVRIRKMVLLK